jgi:GntR family transcriptional regulator
MPINTSTRLQQVKSYLLNYITQNQLQRNDQLPSEAAISKTLGVSRNTLREAYISLENEGIIVRRHGIGTFLANSPVIRDSLNEFSPFAQIIQDVGYTPNFETLSMGFEQATDDVYQTLAVPTLEKLRCIKRIVLADQLPVIYVDEYMSPVVESANLNWDNFDGNTVQFLSASLNTPLHQIQSHIRAAALTPEIAQYLKLAEGTPILSVRSTIFTVDNQPVNYSKICFNSDIVELNIVRMIRTK